MPQLRTEYAPRPATEPRSPSLRLLQELPGIADIVWSILARVDSAHDPVRVLFASAERRSGNSVLAAATAVGLLRHVRVPVCLVEANVEHPALAGYLGLCNVGLSDILDGRAELKDCLQSPQGCPGLYVLPGGTPRKPVTGEFSTAKMRSILEQVGALGRYLVLDAPCVLDHLESRVLLQQVDASVLVLRAGASRIDAAVRAHRILLDGAAPVLGSIFNAYGPVGAFSGTDPYQLSKDELGRGGPIDAPVEDAVEEAVHVNGKHPELVEDGDAPEHVNGNGNGFEPARNGAALHAVGVVSEEEHLREIDVLERRIAKLTEQLSQTEAELVRIAAAKNIDLGIASIYRGIQGLSPEEEALALKKELMGKIFQANLELKYATQRNS